MSLQERISRSETDLIFDLIGGLKDDSSDEGRRLCVILFTEINKRQKNYCTVGC